MKLRFILAATAIASLAFQSKAQEINTNSEGKFELPPLEYPENALEKAIDAKTVALHHGKHQAGYVANLNKALESVPEFKYAGSLENLISDLSKVPEQIRLAVRNNGGGVWNHAFYWQSFSPEKSEPSKELLNAIKKSFGSMDAFKSNFDSAALKIFGSGWIWLGVDKDGNLKICSTPNQDSPLMGYEISKCQITPIYCVDVWEHAYYIKYNNRRADYLAAIWNIVNWERLSQRYSNAAK